MQHFLESVNDSRLVFFLRNEVEEDFSDFLIIDPGDRDVDIGGEDASRVNAEDAFEWWFLVDAEGIDIFKLVECLSAENSFIGDSELKFPWISGDKEIANDAEEDERNRHEGTIGENGVGDDERE